MKKICDTTIFGFYAISLLLGGTSAVAISMGLYDAWLEVLNTTPTLGGLAWGESAWWLNSIWVYIPMESLGDALTWYEPRPYDMLLSYVPHVFAATGVLSVVLFVVVMESNKAKRVWRTKLLQAFAIALFLMLGCVIVQVVERRFYGESTTLLLFMPVLAISVPLFILAKTRLSKKDAVATE